MQSTYYYYRTVDSYRCSTRSYRTCHTRFCPPWRCCGPQSGHQRHYTPSTTTTRKVDAGLDDILGLLDFRKKPGEPGAEPKVSA